LVGASLPPQVEAEAVYLIPGGAKKIQAIEQKTRLSMSTQEVEDSSPC
jgi:hypothetical protein